MIGFDGFGWVWILFEGVLYGFGLAYSGATRGQRGRTIGVSENDSHRPAPMMGTRPLSTSSVQIVGRIMPYHSVSFLIPCGGARIRQT